MAAAPSERLAVDDLSGYVFEPVWADGEVVLSRSAERDALPRLLTVAPARSSGGPRALGRLEWAWALRDVVNAAWAARPLALVQHRGRSTLVLEDPGGELLARLVGHPWEVEPFLRVAIGLAAALGRLHARELLHKDIKPANILTNVATGDVWLTGFGLASRQPRELRTLDPPGVIAGTLAYMSPEQTGRMSRSCDSRSDLYAAGVTLYEMLTGTLPFTATDPAELIHSHFARQPPPPAARAPGIPAPIAAIVLKLLSKTADDRYQTAAGLESDLRRCLVAWESEGRIDPFPLGTHDMPDQLRFREKLYGREREIATLLACFDRVVAERRPALVLVSGYSGVGKSSVVHQLNAPLVRQRGLFAAGKFDQH